MTDPVPSTATYTDDDLVYVDPDVSTVIGRVEWNRNGLPKSKPYAAASAPAEEKRRAWRKIYPWGTFRSMKNVFKVDGKPRRKEPTKTLEDVLPMALKEPYWD